MAANEDLRRLSVRIPQETLDVIKLHQAAMEKRTGAPFTMTQAVTSLVSTGFLTWQASDRCGCISPAVLIAKGADSFREREK